MTAPSTDRAAVLGNEPFEVVADYTLNLDPTVATVTGAWS